MVDEKFQIKNEPTEENNVNPWQVDSIRAFSFLKCPECTFDTKEEESFQDHALENHPLSIVLFGDGKKIKEEFQEIIKEQQGTKFAFRPKKPISKK